MFLMPIFRSPRSRSASAANSLPASVIETWRVLREKSETPRAPSICFIVRVSEGCDVFRKAAAAMKLRYSATARTARSWRELTSGKELARTSSSVSNIHFAIAQPCGNLHYDATAEKCDALRKSGQLQNSVDTIVGESGRRAERPSLNMRRHLKTTGSCPTAYAALLTPQGSGSGAQASPARLLRKANPQAHAERHA